MVQNNKTKRLKKMAKNLKATQDNKRTFNALTYNGKTLSFRSGASRIIGEELLKTGMISVKRINEIITENSAQGHVAKYSRAVCEKYLHERGLTEDVLSFDDGVFYLGDAKKGGKKKPKATVGATSKVTTSRKSKKVVEEDDDDIEDDE